MPDGPPQPHPGAEHPHKSNAKGTLRGSQQPGRAALGQNPARPVQVGLVGSPMPSSASEKPPEAAPAGISHTSRIRARNRLTQMTDDTSHHDTK